MKGLNLRESGLLQGPFPGIAANTPRASRLSSFGVDTEHIYASYLWRRLRQLVEIGLMYLSVFFKLMSLVLLVILHLGSSPSPQIVEDGYLAMELMLRERDDAIKSGHSCYPSFGEVFDYQPEKLQNLATGMKKGCPGWIRGMLPNQMTFSQDTPIGLTLFGTVWFVLVTIVSIVDNSSERAHSATSCLLFSGMSYWIVRKSWTYWKKARR